MTFDDNWEKARGVVCPKCHQESFRIRLIDGVCISCALRQDDKDVRDREKKQKFLRFLLAHNARVARNTRGA